MIEFQDGSETRVGEVWSPGPVAQSVWVLVDGEAMAVKLATSKQLARRIEFWFNAANFTRYPMPAQQVAYINDHKYAPQLGQKLWREALDGQLTLSN